MTQELTVVPGDAGARAIVSFDLAAAQQRLRDIVAKQELITEAMRSAMVEGVDYGQVGDVAKPFLLRPGAEKLCDFFQLSPHLSRLDKEDLGGGHLSVQTVVSLTHRASGQHWADGVGEANTREARYSNRWVTLRNLPEGLDPTHLKQRERPGQYGPYVQYLVENDDLYTLHNTIVQMSYKRALVAAVRLATCSSGIFEQGLEEVDPETGEVKERRGGSKPPAARKRQEPKPDNPLSGQEWSEFWKDAKAAGLTREQVLSHFDDREPATCTRDEVMDKWAEFRPLPSQEQEEAEVAE